MPDPKAPAHHAGRLPSSRAGQAFAVAFLPLVVLAMLQTGLPVLAPALIEAAGATPSDYGWIAGAMGLGSVWLYMANAAFTTPLGPVRATQVAGIVAAAGVALVLTGRLGAMVAGATLIGFGYAAMTPVGSELLALHTARARRATLFSLRQAGVPLGGVLAGSAGTVIAAAFGWRAALGLFGVLALLVAPVLVLVPRGLDGAAQRPRFRIAKLFAARNLGAPFRTIRAVPGLGRISLACIGFSVVQGTVNTYFALYATTELGLSLVTAGTLFATMQSTSVLGRVVLGFVADRVGSPMPVLRCLSLLSGASALLLASLSGAWPSALLYLALAFMGLCIATWNGLYLAEVATIAPERVGEASAAATFFVFATYMVTPPIMGVVIATAGYRAAFVAAAASVLTAFLVLVWPQKVPVRGRPSGPDPA